MFGPRIGVRGMFELFSVFALELAALAAVEVGGRVVGVRFWVLGARCFTLTPAPVSSTGQALSQDGRGGRGGGVWGGPFSVSLPRRGRNLGQV